MNRFNDRGTQLSSSSSENLDPAMNPELAAKHNTPTRRGPPRRADRLRFVKECASPTVVPMGEIRKKQAAPLGEIRSSWREEQRNQELQARARNDAKSTTPLRQVQKTARKEVTRNQELQARQRGGLNAKPASSFGRIRSSWREEMENHQLREGKSVNRNRQQENRVEPEQPIKVVPRPPPVKPTAAEMDEIRAKVGDVVSEGAIAAILQAGAAIRIQAAFRASQARHALYRHLNARKIQTIWRGVGPRRERAAVLHQINMENVATRKIQAMWRMVPVRRRFRSFQGAKKIQTAWRCYSVRSMYTQYLRTKAASTVLQSAWRSFKCYCEYTIARNDIVIVQRIARDYIVRKRRLQQRSATDIQRVFRGYKGRKVFANMWKKHVKQCKALDIQRVFRGSRARISAARLRGIKNAATTIQRYWRSYDAQQSFWFFIGSVIDIQSWVRGMAVRDRYASKLRSIVVAQSVVRRWLAPRQVGRIRQAKRECTSATMIQASWRCHSARQQYLQYKVVVNAATKMQTAWRSFLCYSDYMFAVADIVAVQRFARVYIRRQQAATMLQSAWRSYVCHTDYVFTILDIVTIQRSFRRHIGRKAYALKYEEREQQRASERLRQRRALDIQRVFRGSTGRMEVAMIRRKNRLNKAATTIQSYWRSNQAQAKLWYTIGCTIRIQSWTRAVMGRLRYVDSIGSIIISQSAVRRWIARNKYNHMRTIVALNTTARLDQARENEAANTLQFWYRNTVHPKITNEAATKIQSFFRMVKAMIDREVALALKRRKDAARSRQEAAKHRMAAVITVQSFFRMVRAIVDREVLAEIKQRSEAATKVQSFFRMVKAMVDREIYAEIKRRKIRKMLKTRTKATDDLMLEEAWGTVSTSPGILCIKNVKCARSKVSRPRSTPEQDASSQTTEIKSSTRSNSIKKSEQDTSSQTTEIKSSTRSDSIKKSSTSSATIQDLWQSMSMSEETVCEAKHTATENVRCGRSKRTAHRETSLRGRAAARRETGRNASHRNKAGKPSNTRLLLPSYNEEEVIDDQNRPTEMVRWHGTRDDDTSSDVVSDVSALTTLSFMGLQIPRPELTALAVYRAPWPRPERMLTNMEDHLSQCDESMDISVDDGTLCNVIDGVTSNKKTDTEKGKRHLRSRSVSREPTARYEDI